MKFGIVLLIGLAVAASSAAQGRRNAPNRPLSPYNVLEVRSMTAAPKAVARGFPVGLDDALRSCLIAELAQGQWFDKIIDGEREYVAGGVRPRQAEAGEHAVSLTTKIAAYEDRGLKNLKSQIQMAAMVFIPFAWTTSRATATASTRFEAELRDPATGQLVLKLKASERCCGIRDSQVNIDNARDYVTWKALNTLAVAIEQNRRGLTAKRPAPARSGCPVTVSAPLP